MHTASASIGMFDSGLGGLTVMQQLLRLLPNEHIVYFGDTARLPYGDKSPATIIRYSLENANFLLEKNIKMLIIACSTATAHALDSLQQTYSLPIVGAIDPGAQRAIETSKNGRVAVLGTKGTIHSQAYQKAIIERDPHAYILPIACPLFVPLVEEHFTHHPAARLIVQEYLKPLESQHIDTLILGCTHYPLLKELIRQEVGEQITIIDSAAACAEQVAKLLHGSNLDRSTCNQEPHHYFVSDDPHKFQSLGKSFLGLPIDKVELSTLQPATSNSR